VDAKKGALEAWCKTAYGEVSHDVSLTMQGTTDDAGG
jgi:hypothetical protein